MKQNWLEWLNVNMILVRDIKPLNCLEYLHLKHLGRVMDDFTSQIVVVICVQHGGLLWVFLFFFYCLFHWTHLILFLVLYHNLHYIYRESEISTGLVGGWGRTRHWAKTDGFWMIFMFTFLLLVNLVHEGKYEFNILPSVCIFSHASNSGSLISSGYLLNASVNTCKLFVNLDDFG